VARIAGAVVLMVAITVALYSLPEKSSEWLRSREMIRKLYLFPILLSAMWFGARGAASSTMFATLVCGGLAGNAWPEEVPSQVERIGEVAVFWLVGALSASFFEQQKRFVGQIEVANDNTLLALAAALDVREHNTGVHSQRVADYMLRLAREVGVRDKDKLDVFWRGALLHDVGKIGIPDNVLLKPGPLSEEEWVVMRNHPEVGARMLQKIEFLRGPSEIVLSHHEWYDGAGYPRKLKGAEIQIGARLFAAIDVYDALTTDRAYHTARSHTDALTKIREKADTHLDPAVVAAFEKIPFEELRDIAKKNQTPLLFASPPVPSQHQVASVLSPLS
jgi:putative nucleotidyltransferase with HDIG domain